MPVYNRGAAVRQGVDVNNSEAQVAFPSLPHPPPEPLQAAPSVTSCSISSHGPRLPYKGKCSTCSPPFFFLDYGCIFRFYSIWLLEKITEKAVFLVSTF